MIGNDVAIKAVAEASLARPRRCALHIVQPCVGSSFCAPTRTNMGLFVNVSISIAQLSCDPATSTTLVLLGYGK